MLTRHQKHAIFKSSNQHSSGYVLVVTVVLLAALLIMTLNFFERTADSLQMSGYNRESAESLILTESAMNFIYGRLLYEADFNNNDIVDLQEDININKLDETLLHYFYFVSAANDIDQSMPSILQRIANGEARGEQNSVNGHIVNVNTKRLSINDLYSDSARPLVFEFDEQNQLKLSNKHWSEIANNSSSSGAVAWFEIVKNDELDGTLQVYVQAVGKVGDSKNYLQRLVLSTSTTLGSFVPTFAQSN